MFFGLGRVRCLLPFGFSSEDIKEPSDLINLSVSQEKGAVP